MTDDTAQAMAALTRSLRRRIAADERKAERKADTRPGFDYRGLSKLVRTRIDERGLGYRAAAAEIGVTASDLSRIGGAQGIVFEKVVAICDWLGIPERRFYTPPSIKSNCCSAAHVKHASDGTEILP